eukprot:CAMPEP_0119042886 /NCGR_PEP_ID=MMETSP1177-20130426/16240_1 /TAXON_ID=2985 /ORGANISM="Ochromonas sp, Strain CCMP1899" /LENGTH=66 /DNA_ID=CAMNT_0007009963 /DNA_START=499 /DNA_END=699 /DNA_ORIENTATION=-
MVLNGKGPGGISGNLGSSAISLGSILTFADFGTMFVMNCGGFLVDICRLNSPEVLNIDDLMVKNTL